MTVLASFSGSESDTGHLGGVKVSWLLKLNTDQGSLCACSFGKIQTEFIGRGKKKNRGAAFQNMRQRENQKTAYPPTLEAEEEMEREVNPEETKGVERWVMRS